MTTGWRRARTTIVVLLALAALGALAPAVVRLPGSDVLFAISVAAFPALLVALALGPRAISPAGLTAIGGLLLLLEGTVLALLLLRDRAEGPLAFGLPAGGLAMLAGLWLLPLLLVALAHVWTSSSTSLDDDDLARLRALAAVRRSAGDAEDGR